MFSPNQGHGARLFAAREPILTNSSPFFGNLSLFPSVRLLAKAAAFPLFSKTRFPSAKNVKNSKLLSLPTLGRSEKIYLRK